MIESKCAYTPVRFAAAAVACVTLLLASHVSAQTNTATLSGTITDQKEAAIPGVAVTVLNDATSFERKTTSNGLGYFTVPLLQPGSYRVRVEKEGFGIAEARNVLLNVNDQRVLNISLAVAAVSQTITVVDESDLANASPSIGTTIGSQAIGNLPLNGRNFQGLSALVPGAIPANGTRDANSGGVSLSGTRSYDNAFLLDGVDDTPNAVEAITRINVTVTPNLDAIQEFKIQSSSYDAQFGHTVGGVINIISKSGTNQFHGTLYDYLRNAALNANTWQNNEAGLPKSKRIRNQYGGVVGGPVTIPKLYDGKNHTFFFLDYEEVRDIQQPTLATLVMPDAKMRTGDFSEFLGQFNLGAPYVNNVLPKSLIDPVSAQLAALYPLPNVAGTLNYQTLLPNTFNERKIGARIDHRFSDRDSIYGRYTYDNQEQLGSTWSDLLSPASQQLTIGHTGGVTETHLFSPNLINEARFGYTHSNPERTYSAPNRDLYAEFGLTGIPTAPASPTGQFQFSGFPSVTNIGHGAVVIDTGMAQSYSDNLTWNKGAHAFKAGVEIRRVSMTDFEPQAPRGQFQFYDQNATDATGNPLTVGFAQFLTGAPSKVTFSTANGLNYQNYASSFYGQDTWRVTRSLTLHLGLRYEYYSPVTEANDHQANFDADTGVLIYPKSFTGQLPVSLTGVPVNRNGSSELIQTDKANFAPRLGFAYEIGPATVLRGGYGIYYGFQEIGPWSFPSPGYNPPFNLVWSPTPQRLSNGYVLDPINDPSTQFQIASMPTHLHTPRVSQWNVSLQRSLGKDLTLEGAYSGAHGHDLYTLVYFNQSYPGTTFDDLQSRLPFPDIQDTSQQTNNGGYSNYNALLLKLEKRMSNGLSLLASYTWSHSLDNASDANLGSQHAGDTFRDPRHLNWEYGNSDFDVRNRFVASALYEISVGKGRAFGSNLNPFMNAVIGGWMVNAIWTWQSGYWYTPFGINDSCFCNDGNANSLRPDVVLGQSVDNAPRNPQEWFNINAFTADVPSGRHGDAGRNIILGPGLINVDLGIHKDFPVTERARFQFRAEFFDVTNHPNFDKPVLQMSNPNFGVIQDSLTAREIQLALKFLY